MEPSSQATGNDEQKYVTLETGSKLSGYTQDYLERLCRLKKVGYRIRTDGQFVIELESLLQETQTILLSHDGVSFVDKGELADPVPEVTRGVLSSALKEVKTVTATMPYSSTLVSSMGLETASVSPAIASPAIAEAELSERSVSTSAPEVSAIMPSVTTPIPVVTQAANSEVVNQISFQPLIPNIEESMQSVPTPVVLPEPMSEESVPPVFVHMPIIGQTPPTPPVPSVSAPVREQVVEFIPAPMSTVERISIAPHPLSIPIAPRPAQINTDALGTVPQSSAFVPTPVESPQTSPSPLVPQSAAPIVSPAEINISDFETNALPLFVVPVEMNAPSLPVADLASVKQSVPFGSFSVQSPIKEEVSHQEVLHDNWGAPLLDAAAVTIATPPKTLSVPKKPIPLNREYHPIQTSVDPRVHHDDAPLFPVLNPDGVRRQGDTEVKFNVSVLNKGVPRAPSSTSESTDSRQRVIVYAPEDYLQNKLTGNMSAVPNTLDAMNPPTPPVPSFSTAPQSEPVLPAAIIRKEGTVPSLRVMPGLPAIERKILPMKEEEHRVSVKEDHPLIKNVGLNLVFAAVLVSSSFVFLNSAISNLGKRLSDLDNAAYVAGVGAADMNEAIPSVPDTQKNADELTLPFSDDVLVSPGSKTNSVIVQPIFKTGPGNSYEYTLTPTATTSTSTP